MKNINKSASLAIITASLFLGFSYAFAWTAPTSQPPAGNVEAPLNTGTIGQYKAGALGFEGVLRGYSDAIFDGKVGIGTGATALTESLEVNGGIKAKNGILRSVIGSGSTNTWTEYSWTHLNTAPDTWRKIATMPASSGSTGDQLWLKVRVSGTSSTNAASADVRMGQRSSFNASISDVFGALGQLANAGIRAYQQVDGTTDVYAYHKNATYIGLAVEASAVGFASTATMVSPSSVTSTTVTPTGTLVFDSTTEYTTALTAITSAGNVGIGTTAPATKLEVAGQVKITGGTPGLNKVLTSDATGLATWQAAGSFDATNIITGVGIGQSNTTASSLKVGSSAVDLAAIGNGDLVGGTTSGGFQFDGSGGNLYIQKAAANGTGAHIYGRKSRGTMSAAAAVVSGDDTLLLRGYGHDGVNFIENARITFDTEGTIGTGVVPGKMKFATANATGVVTDAITIDSNGEVGIGTTVPTQKLEIYGNILQQNTNTLKAKNSAGTAEDWMWPRYSDNKTYTNFGSAGWNIRNNSSVSRMFITDGGYVGIGTTAPGATLDVNGDALVNGITVGRGSGNISSNSANGYQSLYSNTTGTSNTANGYQSLYSNTTGTSNTANGSSALKQNTGNFNTANGAQALYANTSGAYNTANGVNALRQNTTGILNTANGAESLWANTTGNENTANGVNALHSNTTGYSNTSNGVQSLYFNTTGYMNTANGYKSLYTNTAGSWNTSNGYQSLYSNTGNWNTANGVTALFSNTAGYMNTANGLQALYSNSTGDSNTANGVNALFSNTTGYMNTANGRDSLYSNTTGLANTAIGGGSLDLNTTGSKNTAIGYGADVATNALTNATAIGYGAIASASNRVRIGDTLVTQIGGQVGWSALSDARQKENVEDYAHGLDFIMKLRPVTYNLIADKTKATHSGFLAQEVEATGVPFYGLNKPANDKDFYSLNYSEFVVPLVNSVKELKEENDKLRADNEALRAEVKANNDALIARIEKLEAGR